MGIGKRKNFFHQETNELTGYEYELGGDFSITYQRDDLGRITSINEVMGHGSNSIEYSYDTTGRLKTVTDNTGTTTYVYDSNSNITEKRGPASTETASYDEQDRLISFGSLTFNYNDHGELQSKTDSTSNQSTSYVYDSFGNLKQVRLPTDKIIKYQVDGFNRRVIRKTDNGATVDKYIFKDQLNPVRIFRTVNGQSSILNFSYVTKQHVPDMMRVSGSYYRIISDHLGSVREVRDAAGNLMQELRYDAFGKVISDSNPGFQPFGYAGGLYDHETGLVRFGARDYDASVGRWLSKDPTLFSGDDTNLYGYSFQDPINFIDIEGERARIVSRIGQAGRTISSIGHRYLGPGTRLGNRLFGPRSLLNNNRYFRIGYKRDGGDLAFRASSPYLKSFENRFPNAAKRLGINNGHKTIINYGPIPKGGINSSCIPNPFVNSIGK